MPSIIEIVMMVAIVAAAIFGYLNYSMLKSACVPATTTPVS